MLYRSTAYKNAIKGTVRNFNAHIRFNGTATEVRANTGGIVSIKHYSSVADADRPMFGCAVSSYVEATWMNSAVSGVSLANSYIDVWIGPVYMSGGYNTYDPKYLGRFWIADISRGDTTTTVTAYDELSKLAKEYVPTVTPSGGVYAIADIVDDIVTQCGLGYASSTLTGTVDTLYSGTCREVLGWVCNVTSDSTFNGCNIKPHRIANSTTPQNLALNTASLYTAWQSKDDYEIDENTIYLGGLDDAEDFEVQSVVSGTNDAPVSVGNGTGLVGPNPYMTSAIATDIYNNVNGIQFTPMTIEFRGDPAIEIGDVVKVTKGGVSKYCYIQRFVTHFDGGLKQDLYCYGDSEYYYDMSTSPTTAKINTVSTMLQEIAQSIETANGGVITKILDTDGTWKELVIANSADLNTATSVWRWNINGLAHSTSYSGGTYTFALDDQGRMIANVIQTGILTDANGYNSWNLDTGAFTITEGTINITTSADNTNIIQLAGPNYSTAWMPQMIRMQENDSPHKTTELSPALGLRIYDDNGAICGIGQARMWVGGSGLGGFNGQIYIRDDSDVTRCDGNINGFTFYNSSSNATGFYPADMQSVSDLNDTTLLPSLMYQYTSSASNIPVSGTGGHLVVTHYTSSTAHYITQRAYPNVSRQQEWMREYNNGTWTEWKRTPATTTELHATSGTTATYTIPTGTTIVTTARQNSTSTTQDGLWIVSVGASNSHLTAIKSPTGGTTVSLSGSTLPLTTGAANVRVTLTDL